jgi:hypothetical protein
MSQDNSGKWLGISGWTIMVEFQQEKRFSFCHYV